MPGSISARSQPPRILCGGWMRRYQYFLHKFIKSRIGGKMLAPQLVPRGSPSSCPPRRIGDAYPDLGPNQPYNAGWSIRALVQYDKHLYDRIAAADECNQMAFTLSSYNSGSKWVDRDQLLAAQQGFDPFVYWGNVERVNAGRTAAAWKESRGYPLAIMKTLQPTYAMWGRRIVC